MYTNVMIHNFCNLMLTQKPQHYISLRNNLNVVKLARDFLFQHALDNKSELLPNVIDSINEWFDKWQGKQNFLKAKENKQ